MAALLLPQHTPPTAELVLRQEPKLARMSARSDRRPIDPLIVEVLVPRSLSLFVSAALVKEDTDETVLFLEDGKTCSTHGTLISDVHRLNDPENGATDAGFAVFADVSIRAEGVFRLRLSLYEITEDGVKLRTCIFSIPFRVDISEDFPSTKASSRLACSLVKQDVKIRVREVRPCKQAGTPLPVARLVPLSEAFRFLGVGSKYVKRHATHPVPPEPPRKRARLTSPVNPSSTCGSPRSSSSLSVSLPPISALGLPPFATSILPPLPPPPPYGYGYGPPSPPSGYGYGLTLLPNASWAAPLSLPYAAVWPPPLAVAPWPSPPHTPEALHHLPRL